MWMEGWWEVKRGRRGEERNELEKVSLGVLGGMGSVLHSAGAAPVVAVVEFETFALEDECAEAILHKLMVSVFGASYGMRLIVERHGHTLAVEVVRRAFTGMFVVIAVERTCSAVWMRRS